MQAALIQHCVANNTTQSGVNVKVLCGKITEKKLFSNLSIFTAKPSKTLTGKGRGIAGKAVGVRPREVKFHITRALLTIQTRKRELTSKKIKFKGLIYVQAINILRYA
jgi:hypothetical protein